MKKLSTILCTLALLFIGVGSANVYAGKYHASIHWSWYCNAEWNSGTNTMSWTGVWTPPAGSYGSTFYFLDTDLPNGDITSYTKFHATLSDFSDNVDHIWLRIKQGDNNYAEAKLVAGENNIDLAALATANPGVDFKNVTDITLWGAREALEGKTIGAGDNKASVKITNAYLYKSSDVYIGRFGDAVTSLDYITGGGKFVISDNGAKAIYYKGNQDYKNAAYGLIPSDSYFYMKLEKVEDSGVSGDNIYRIRIQNGDGTDYPNGISGGSYVNITSWGSMFSGTSASGANNGYGVDGQNWGLWYVTYDAEKGFSFQSVGREKWMKVDGTADAQQYVKLYKSLSFKVNSELDPTDVEITVGNETRNYQLYVPNNVQTNSPLVLSLHGAGGHSTDYSPFKKEVADAEGCIVAYPQGKNTLLLGNSTPGWTATGEDNFDVKFLKAVIEDVASKYQIDRKRIYCCGFSNGGMMTYAMANACSDEIAAFASISGFPLNEFHLRHAGARPVPFLHIHGKADDFVKYSLMPTIVDEMVARLGANPVPTTTTGNGYTKSFYAAGDGSFPYVYYEIDGMGHVDYTDKTEDGNSAQTMWNFFEQYTLDSQCDETLKWAPSIETQGYDPTAHGWTVNSGTTLLQFGGDQNTGSGDDGNHNVYHSLQFENGKYKLCFNSTGAAVSMGVKIEKLTSPNTVVLDETVNVGAAAELPFEVTDSWGEYKLTITRPTESDAISVTGIKILQTEGTTPVQNNHYRLYASGLSTDGTNATYENGKLKWTSTGNNVAGAITADAGVIAKFSSIHFTCSALTQGATYRVMLTTASGTNYISEINATGEVTVNFSDLTKQWGTEHPTPEVLATVTQVRIGGGTSGSPSAENPYEMTMDISSFYIESEEDQLSIANTDDWVIFSKMVNSGVSPLNAQLTADVDAGSTMVGTSAKPYTGTFDGAGHTLTFNYDGSTSNEIAPFRYINNATINNLTTTGSINAQNIFGGIVGTAGGASTLNYCTSSMTLTANHNGDTNNGRVGGFVGRCADNATPVGTSITFNNCLFNGEISSTTASRCCGFVGWARSTTVTANNCLIAPTSVTNGNQNIAATGGTNPTVTTTNSYYTVSFGSAQGTTKASDAEVVTGQLCYKLNGQNVPSSTYFWGQGKLNSSAVELPSLTSVASKKVLRLYGDDDVDHGYANPNGMLPDPANYHTLAWKLSWTFDPIYYNYLTPDKTTDTKTWGLGDNFLLTVGTAGATTLVLPFEVTAEKMPDGVKAYTLSYSSGNAAVATPVDNIPANTPVLINAPAGEYLFASPYAWNANVNYAINNNPVEGSYYATNGALTGVYNTTMPFSYVPANAYVLQNGTNGIGFYKVTADNKIKITSFRAYLTAQSSARSLNIIYNDNETTGISDASRLMDSGEMIKDNVYDLQGRRVAKPTKGLYIMNGKKIVK